MYSWEKVMNMPLATPMRKRAKYIAPMFVLAIMMMLATEHMTAAIHILPRRPMNLAMGPAKEELAKAPNVMREEMSCCRSVEMFHPVKVAGSWYPKIYYDDVWSASLLCPCLFKNVVVAIASW